MIDGETLAEAVRDTLDLFLADHPALAEATVQHGDHDWSTNGQLVGIIVDGQRFTLTLTPAGNEP